ncbi:Hypothetical predicted protein, partial [Paramuricea clavata]
VQRKLSVQSKADGRSILFGETPKTIRLRQFTEISKAQGYKSEVEFARAVVCGNTTERLRMLMEYYKRKEYPNESIESYSQTIQSSQELNTGRNLKENEKVTKKKGSVNLARHYRKSSTRQKSFTKVLKTPIAKPNKSDRHAKKCSKYLKTKAESNASESSTVSETTVKEQHKIERLESFASGKLERKAALSLRNNADKSFCNIADNLLDKTTDRTNSAASYQTEAKSSMSPTDYGDDKSLDKGLVGATSCVSPTNTENVCEDILNDILTACSDTNTRCTQYGRSLRELERTSNTPPLANRRQDSQSSSFLDEFLFECSQRAGNRSQDSLSQYESQGHKTECVEQTNSCEKMQTSIIDDLI